MSPERRHHNNPTSEAVPHSGKGGHERPLPEHETDTPLDETFRVPESTADFHPTEAEEALRTANRNALPLERYDQKRRRRNILIAAGAAAATLVASGALALGVRAMNNDEEPRQEPGSVTAPLNPGTETHPVDPTESEGTQEVTAENVKLVFNGETYTGVEAFTEAAGVSAEEYPDPEAAAHVLIIDRPNEWINNGNQPDAYGAYRGSYVSQDEQRTGVSAVAQDFINPAFTEALSATSPDVNVIHTPDSLMNKLAGQHFEIMSTGAAVEDGDIPFQGKYTMERLVDHGYDEELGIAAFAAYRTYEDNGNENTVGELRSQPGGYRGVATPQVTERTVLHFTMQIIDGRWQIIGAQELPNEN